jgi:hypothetical protein
MISQISLKSAYSQFPPSVCGVDDLRAYPPCILKCCIRPEKVPSTHVSIKLFNLCAELYTILFFQKLSQKGEIAGTLCIFCLWLPLNCRKVFSRVRKTTKF